MKIYICLQKKEFMSVDTVRNHIKDNKVYKYRFKAIDNRIYFYIDEEDEEPFKIFIDRVKFDNRDVTIIDVSDIRIYSLVEDLIDEIESIDEKIEEVRCAVIANEREREFFITMLEKLKRDLTQTIIDWEKQ